MATPLKGRRRCNEQVTADDVSQALLKGVSKAQLQAVKKTGILVQYDLKDPQNPYSRSKDRGALEQYQGLLKEVLPLGPVNKSVYAAGMKLYASKVDCELGLQ